MRLIHNNNTNQTSVLVTPEEMHNYNLLDQVSIRGRELIGDSFERHCDQIWMSLRRGRIWMVRTAPGVTHMAFIKAK